MALKVHHIRIPLYTLTDDTQENKNVRMKKLTENSLLLINYSNIFDIFAVDMDNKLPNPRLYPVALLT